MLADIVVLESTYLLSPPQKKKAEQWEVNVPLSHESLFIFGGQVPGLAGTGRGTIDEPQNVDHHLANVRKFSKRLDLMKMFREMFFPIKTMKMGGKVLEQENPFKELIFGFHIKISGASSSKLASTLKETTPRSI